MEQLFTIVFEPILCWFDEEGEDREQPFSRFRHVEQLKAITLQKYRDRYEQLANGGFLPAHIVHIDEIDGTDLFAVQFTSAIADIEILNRIMYRLCVPTGRFPRIRVASVEGEFSVDVGVSFYLSRDRALIGHEDVDYLDHIDLPARELIDKIEDNPTFDVVAGEYFIDEHDDDVEQEED